MNKIIENFILTIHKNKNIFPAEYAFYEFPYQLQIGSNSQITWYSNEQYLFILYGEVTNFKELAKENHFSLESNFSIIISLFEKYGMRFFDELRGRYAIILIDKTKCCAYISKDYIGTKALYYFESNEAIYITSHARNLNFLTSVNRNYIKKVLDGERIYGTETAFDGVKCVPSGEVMLLVETRKIYFHKLNYNIPTIRYRKKSEYYEHFCELLQKILNKNINTNVAFTISGGLDCTLLSHIFSRASKQQIQAYTFDLSSYGKSSEEIYIRDIEKNREININYVDLKDKFLENIITKNYDEPNHYILTNAWDIMLNQCKGEAVSSLVTGFGGDEITVGYEHIDNSEYIKQKAERSFLSMNEKKLHLYTNSNILHSGQIYYSNVKIPPNINSSYVKIYNRLFSGEIGRLIYRYEQDCFEKTDIKFILPFLERDIIEFSLGIPVDVHADKGMTKKLQRKAGCNLIPKSIEKRKDKSDFFHWYIIELLKQYDFVEDLISNSIVLNENYGANNIIEIVRAFYAESNMNYLCRKEQANKILDFIAVELWLKKLKSGK